MARTWWRPSPWLIGAGLILASAVGHVGLSARADAGRVLPTGSLFAASYPEGPVAGKAVLAVEYGAHRIVRWAGGQSGVLATLPGTGPASLFPDPAGDLWVSGYDSKELIRLSPDGQVMERVTTRQVPDLAEGPNDFASDRQGGFYVSVSGAFDRTAPVAGSILHRTAAGRIRRVADRLHYPNGLGLSPDGRHLYVAEHLAYRVQRFDVAPDGSLGKASTWLDLQRVVPRRSGDDVLKGPDGLKVDRQGRVYVCLYGGGGILIIGRDGRLERTVPVPAPYVTNVALTPDERELIVTAAWDTNAPPYPGVVLRLANPAAAGS